MAFRHVGETRSALFDLSRFSERPHGQQAVNAMRRVAIICAHRVRGGHDGAGHIGERLGHVGGEVAPVTPPPSTRYASNASRPARASVIPCARA